MHLYIEDETQYARNERILPKTNLYHYKLPQIPHQHTQPFSMHAVPGWWRNYLLWHRALAAHSTNCLVSFLYRLPSEILVLIADHLKAHDAFYLAMCCRHRSYAPDFARLRVSLDVLRLSLEKEDAVIELV